MSERAQASVLLLAASALLAAREARANGAFPDEFSIHFPADAPHRILMGANFGLLVSEDDALTWRYSCEPWVVSGSNAALAFENVSFYQVTADGGFLADAVKTVTRSPDVGCTWPASTGSINEQSVADIFADPNDASLVLAIIQQSNGSSSIVASHDGGRTFDATHVHDTADLLTGVELARSKAGVVYATSISTTGGPPKFLASADAGTTWTETILQIPAGTEPRILTIDPADEKRVWLRLIGGLTDAVALTTEGGLSFQTVLTLTGPLSSFLRAGDGTIYAGMAAGKLYVQRVGERGFTEHAAPHLRCLGQRPGTTRIWACTDLINDGYNLASSDDGGLTFQPVMSFRQLLGPLACGPVQANCQAHWERIQSVLGIGSDAGPSTDAGAGGPPQRPGGSHCSSAGDGLWAIWGLLALRRRRRRSTTAEAATAAW